MARNSEVVMLTPATDSDHHFLMCSCVMMLHKVRQFSSTIHEEIEELNLC
jgi:hypothetical protein